jgi:hypothetical protein
LVESLINYRRFTVNKKGVVRETDDPLLNVRYQFMPSVRKIGRLSCCTGADTVVSVSVAALAETLLPATMARTATGTRIARRKRGK